jgi:Xaa-Pro aminopeptidase
MYLNRERAQGIMKSAGLDVLVATNLRNVTYFSDYPQMHECTLTPTVFAVLAADPSIPPFLVLRAASLPVHHQEKCWIREVEVYSKPFVCLPDDVKEKGMTVEEQLLYRASKGVEMPPKPLEALRQALEKRGLLRGRIGVDESGLPQPKGWDEMVAALAGATVEPAALTISKIRLVKTRAEISLMERAASLNDAGLKACLGAVRKGGTELEASVAYRQAVWRRGGTPHYANVGYGTRSAVPTKPPATIKPRKGDVVKFDFDCIYNYYFADLGRTGIVGKPSDKIQRYYTAVEMGLEAVKDAVKPGVKPSELFHLGIDTVRKAGIPYFSTTYIGHAIGMWCYDGLIVGPMEDRPLEEGMVLNLEPSHYELGLGAFHAEDTVVVTRTGHRTMSGAPLKLYEL